MACVPTLDPTLELSGNKTTRVPTSPSPLYRAEFQEYWCHHMPLRVTATLPVPSPGGNCWPNLCLGVTCEEQGDSVCGGIILLLNQTQVQLHKVASNPGQAKGRMMPLTFLSCCSSSVPALRDF